VKVSILVQAAALLIVLPSAARADESSGAWLGVTTGTTPAGAVEVVDVYPGSPAEKSLRKGDVLLRANGVALRTPEDLDERLAQFQPGATLELEAQHDGQERTVRLVLADLPSLETLVRHQHIDKPAPELNGVVGVGGAAAPRLAALRGRVVVLEFYAGWCPNCRAVSPVLARWHERYKDLGLAVVGVTSDDPEQAARVVRDWRIPYPVGCAADDLPYAAVALPTTFLIDRKGVVREVTLGRSAGGWSSMENRLKRLLAENG
jgi:thiol-disulfide isomerase/thioredoxin